MVLADDVDFDSDGYEVDSEREDGASDFELDDGSDEGDFGDLVAAAGRRVIEQPLHQYRLSQKNGQKFNFFPKKQVGII